MKPAYFLLPVFSLLSINAQADTKLIPLPSSMKVLDTIPLTLSPDSVIVAVNGAKDEAETLAKLLRAATGFDFPVKTSGSGAIMLALDPTQAPALGKEGYRLESNAKGVRIVAATLAGLFHGGQTLRQLLPPQAMSPKAVAGVKWTVPAVSIEDQPRFAWRGFMLDESRQFFGMEYVKLTLDNMAALKLNIFHWHLTDDEGWRVEIKSLPKLTEIGAWRGTECPLPDVRGENHKRYGGFYTQEQIREIVAYAKERHIDIMPEIDLPGHARAIVTAYPETLPTKVGGGVSAQGFKGNVISPARPEALAIVDKIYEELSALFPFEYIHIGGDEVNHESWTECPQIKKLMEEEHLADFHQVQVHFTKRLEGVVARHGKKLFGWNEIMDGNLYSGTGIMSWIGTGPGYNAAKQGFPVVMCPGQHCYFDMGYGGATGEPPAHWWAGDVSVARSYSFDPLGDGGDLPQDAKDRILGVQGALWTEYVRPWKGDLVEFKTYAEHADYKIWPRLASIAEIGWTPQSRRNYDDFSSRLDHDFYQRLEANGTNFRVPLPDAVTLKAGWIQMEGPFPGADVRYTFDGSVPTEKSPRYEKPFALDGRDPGRLRVRTFLDGRGSTMISGAKAEPIGGWKEKELKAEPAPFTYDATGNLASAGIWRAVFRRTGGDKPLRLDAVSVTVNGKVVATTKPENLVNKNDRAVARLNIPNISPNAKVQLIATLAAPEGDNVRGVVTLMKSERLEPATTVTSELAGHNENTAAMAGDWDDDTLFWIASQPKKGVLATWAFASPVPARKISLPSGDRNGIKDQLVGGNLEISEDGKVFRKVAEFAYGAADVEFPSATKIKALRVNATEDQKTWVILRDPLMR
ncbi:MAG: family 20 glycosylhydrolase [Luteolibacter sp.]